MKNTWNNSPLCAVLTFITALLLVASFLLTLGAGLVKYVFSDAEFYKKAIANEKYIREVYDYTQDDLEKACVVYEFDFNAIKDCFTHETARKMTEEYVENVVEAIVHGKQCEKVCADPDMFYDAIKVHSGTLDDSDRFKIEDNMLLLSERLADIVTDNINVLSDQSLITKINSLIFSDGTAEKISHLFAVLVLISAILTTVCLIAGYGRFEKRLYICSLCAYVPFLLCLSIIGLFKGMHITEKIILSDNTFKSLFTAICDGLIDTSFYTVLIALAVSLAFLVLSIVLIIRRKKSSNG